MNALINSVNSWGVAALDFALPLLVQSSLLILIVGLLDLALKRRVRASVRYWLWLLVPIKLLLPTSLALPTGIGYWIPQSSPAALRAAALRPTTATITRVPAEPVASMSALTSDGPPLAPHQSHLTAQGVGLLVWWAGAFALLTALVIRSRRCVAGFRNTETADNWVEELSLDAAGSLGLRRTPVIRLITETGSPAICGIVRPVILLPRELLDRLPAEQIRAVLLHELAHLKRGDIWVNAFQVLLQVVFWWHPLLWFSNARIRRVREEAVDETVMAALDREAGIYPDTLLAVAKFALARPVMSLGLIGILESRSALRERVERCLSLGPFEQTRLGLAAWLGLTAAALALLPMAQGDPRPASDREHGNQHPELIHSAAEPNKAEVIVHIPRSAAQDGTVLLGELATNLHPVKITELPGALAKKAARQPRPTLRLTIEEGTSPGVIVPVMEATIQAGLTTRPVKSAPAPSPAKSEAPLAATEPATQGPQALLPELQELRLPELGCDKVPLPELVKWLLDDVRSLHRKGRRLECQIYSGIRGPSGLVTPSSVSTARTPTDFAEVRVSIQPPLKDVRLTDLLDAIVRNADHPIRYDAGGTFVVFTDREGPPDGVYPYTPIVSLDTACQNLGLKANDTNGLRAAMATKLRAAGLNLMPPSRLHFRVHDKEGILSIMIWGTPMELSVAKEVIDSLKSTPPQATAAGEARVAHAGPPEAPSTDSLKPEGVPSRQVPNATTSTTTPTTREKLLSKLRAIRLPEVRYDNVPLGEVAKALSEETRKLDPERRGVAFLTNEGIGSSGGSMTNTVPTPEGSARIVVPVPRQDPLQVSKVLIKIDPPLRDLPLSDLLDVIVKVSGKPIKYVVEDSYVVFTEDLPGPIRLYSRAFQLDPVAVTRSLGVSTYDVAKLNEALRARLTSVGVNLDYPKQFHYRPEGGTLFMRATLEDLERAAGMLAPFSTVTIQPPTGARADDTPGQPVRPAAASNGTVSVSLKNATLAQALRAYASLSGLELSVASGLNESISTIHLEIAQSVPRKEAAAMIADALREQLKIVITPLDDKRASVAREIIRPTPKQELGTRVNQPLDPKTGKPKIEVEVRLLEAPASFFRLFGITLPGLTTNSAAVLTPEQTRALIAAADKTDDMDVLKAPKFTTASGRRTQVRLMPVSSDDGRSVFPSVDVLPTLVGDTSAIDLEVFLTLSGRNNAQAQTNGVTYSPRAVGVLQTSSDTPAATIASNAPGPFLRQIRGQALLKEGETLLIGCRAHPDPDRTDSLPKLSDLPLMGRLFRDEVNARFLVALVTPASIAVNRQPVRSGNEPPPASRE